MNVLLVAVGTHGDVHPFLGIGQALKRRGHRVKLFANGYYEPLARRSELDFVPLGSAEDYAAAVADPNLWHETRGFKALVERAILRQMRVIVERLQEHYVPGETVAAAGSLAFGARIAQDKLGLPLATVHLQPVMLRSVYHSPVLPGAVPPSKTPKILKRLYYRISDFAVIDPLLTPKINAFRSELGLPLIRRPFHDWFHSPRRVIGLFPEWYAPPQPDWPPQVRLTGFPLFDDRGLTPIPPDVDEFLGAGDPPIVFTPGSAMRHGQSFFKASAEVCRLLGRRGILLTRFGEQIPVGLPEGVRHFEYIPFSQILPRVAALVHHGGIGTAAQAMAAGIPQLVMPLSLDQPDNADRLVRLGVARSLPPKAYRAPAVARLLRHLLDSPEVSARCRSIANRFLDSDPLGDTCSLIEQLEERS